MNLLPAFKCKLCEKIFRTEADVSAHFLSKAHNAKYEEFTTSNKNYEFVRNKVTLRKVNVANSNGTFSLEKIVVFLCDLEKTGTNAKIGARKETRN